MMTSCLVLILTLMMSERSQTVTASVRTQMSFNDIKDFAEKRKDFNVERGTIMATCHGIYSDMEYPRLPPQSQSKQLILC